jgi:hypothetical protein
MVKTTQAVQPIPEIKFKQREDIFRIRALGIRALDMDWDIGSIVYEPEDPGRIPLGPDGKTIGVFMLHGGTRRCQYH